MHWIIFLTLIHYALHTEAVSGVNIRQAENNEYPFVVSIGRKRLHRSPEQNHVCNGVLISRKGILTAAHCFRVKLPSEVQVIFGSNDLRKGRKYAVSTWITYNEWAAVNNQIPDSAVNDIGILLLSRPLRNAETSFVNLSPLNVQQIQYKPATVLGFGVTNNNSKSRYLIAGNVKMLPVMECRARTQKYANFRYDIGDTEFCSATEPYILTGCGDSGGPILNMQKELVGINVGTIPARNSTWYELEGCYVDELLNRYRSNLHVSIDFYRDFIDSFR